MKPHFHLHPNSDSVTFLLETRGDQLIDILKEIINEATRCDGCFLTEVEGEIRVDEEPAGLIFGSSAKVAFILPSVDGKRLQVIEALLLI